MRRNRAFAPSVSGLDRRDLMAAGSINFVNGVLNIYGGDGASHAEVAPSATTPGNIAVDVGDGESHEFSAADVKLLWFWGSDDGQDSFENDTNETTIAFLYGSGNTFVGGEGGNIVVDYSPDGSDVDSNGGPVQYVDASDAADGGTHGATISRTRSGAFMIRAY